MSCDKTNRLTLSKNSNFLLTTSAHFAAGFGKNNFYRKALYQYNGEPGRAVEYFKMQIEIREKDGNRKSVVAGLCNLSDTLRLSGVLCEAEAAARKGLAICREQGDEFGEGVNLCNLGLALGQAETGEEALEQALELMKKRDDVQGEGLLYAYLAQHHLWQNQPAQAQTHANRAWDLAHEAHLERDFIRAACRQGQAALALGQHKLAAERLHHALERARKINLVEEELPALTALAELARQSAFAEATADKQNQLREEAHELLESVWEAAERGPYPFLHADALNVLCQLERDTGNVEAAEQAARAAFRLALGVGEPWVYRFGLEGARGHLRALGVAV